MRKTSLGWILGAVLFLGAGAASPAAADPSIHWINHLALLPGDPTVATSFNAISSGVGGGLAGLVVTSTTLGETSGGTKVVWTALNVSPDYLITGVRVCYELSSTASFVSQVRLAQVQDPPSTALILLDDPADLNAAGPTCVDSQATSVDPGAGSVLLDLRVNFGNTIDKIVVRGVGLHVVPNPAGPLGQQIQGLETDLLNHSHHYLTGRGIGHNNTVATSGPGVVPASPEPNP